MAEKINLFIDQGADFVHRITVEDANGSPIDLTTYSGSSMIRKHYLSDTSFSFNVDLSNTGIVTLTLFSNTSSAMSAGRYMYDVELITASNTTIRIAEGIVTIHPEITR